MTPPIEAIVVGVPAHNEERTVDACLTSLLAASALVDVPVRVVVAADACSDHTREIAQRAAWGESLRIDVITTDHRSAGAARAAGVDAGLRSVGAPSARVWVATTDADTVVDPSWLAVHLRWAHAGIDAVAGLVHVAWQVGDDDLAGRYASSIEGGGTAQGHGHVHGANLGLRAEWWYRVGGCGTAASGEDRELWDRLRRAGARILGVDDLRVTTSARRVGRAPAGFAGYLRALLAEEGVA